MRLDLTIPDPLFHGAQRAAAANGLSVEAYFQEALELHLEEEAPIELTDGQLALIAKAEADIDAGHYYTSSEVREYFAQKKSVWTQSRRA